MKRLIPIFLTVGCLFTTFLFAGVTGKITGRVIDHETGKPLALANVIVEGTQLGAATDSNGYYFILNVPPGEYTLVVSMMGYQRMRVEGVRVSVDFTTVQNFELTPTVLELGEIAVVAERKIIRHDLTSSLSIVKSRDIEVMPVETFRELLDLQAGVVKGHIRGGRYGEVAYMIDGISVTDPYSGDIAVEVDNSAIQELQVVSGTFNAEYGQAMSGVVNIVTKKGSDEFSGNFVVWLADYYTTDTKFTGLDKFNPSQNKNVRFTLSGPLLTKNLTFFLTSRYYYNDGWLYGIRKFLPNGEPGDNRIVPMNYYRKLFFQGKLFYQITKGVNLSYAYLDNRINYKEYDHYFKYNPDGDWRRFKTGYNHQLTLTHTITPKTFYSLNIAHFYSSYKHYVYEDPYDPRYVHPDLLTAPSYSFAHAGTKMQHFYRWSKTTTLRVDLTSQVRPSHEMKAGLELQLYNLFMHEFEIIPKTIEGVEVVPFEPYVPDFTAPNHNCYHKHPYLASCYAQDKIEFKDMIVNVGVRFDYFEPDGVVLRDPADPNILDPWRPEHQQMTLEEREKIWWKKATPKKQISPRLGIAYPITDKGVIHFSYGHFLQIPQFEYLYRNPEFEVPKTSGISTILGNADLDAQRTVMYEIGLQQGFRNDMRMDVTLFYRDIRGWVGTSPEINTVIPGTKYVKYVNKDYANVRGVTFSFDKYRISGSKFGFSLAYTYQIAEGTSSNPEDAFNDARAGREPRKEVVPLDWDQRHTLNVTLIFGGTNFETSFIFKYGSGLPYTPRVVQGTRVGRTLYTGLKENCERRPPTVDVDFNYTYGVKLGRLTVALLVKIFNLFDIRNEYGVFEDTGRATYTLEQRTAGGDADPNWFIRPDFYSEPRQVQIGISIEF